MWASLPKAARTTLQSAGPSLRLQAVHQFVGTDALEHHSIPLQVRARLPAGPCVQIAAEEQQPLVPRIVKHGSELRERPMHRGVALLVHQPVEGYGGDISESSDGRHRGRPRPRARVREWNLDGSTTA